MARGVTKASVNGRWAVTVGSAVGCLPLLPLFAMTGVVIAYVAPLGAGPATPLLGGLVGNPVLDGTLAALVLWLLLTAAYGAMGFTSVRRANTRVYGQLCE